MPSLDLIAVTFTFETVQLHPIPRTEAQRFSACPGAKAPSCGHPTLPCPRPSNGAPEAGSRAQGRREVGVSFLSPSIRPSAHSESQRLRTGALKLPPSETQSSSGGQWAACCGAGVYLVVCVLTCLLVTRVLKCRIIFMESLLYQEEKMG